MKFLGWIYVVCVQLIVYGAVWADSALWQGPESKGVAWAWFCDTDSPGVHVASVSDRDYPATNIVVGWW
jgi:hypothetical protein